MLRAEDQFSAVVDNSPEAGGSWSERIILKGGSDVAPCGAALWSDLVTGVLLQSLHP